VIRTLSADALAVDGALAGGDRVVGELDALLRAT
jgi:hypothetical protein